LHSGWFFPASEAHFPGPFGGNTGLGGGGGGGGGPPPPLHGPPHFFGLFLSPFASEQRFADPPSTGQIIASPAAFPAHDPPMLPGSQAVHSQKPGPEPTILWMFAGPPFFEPQSGAALAQHAFTFQLM